jgi:hypothetical protein
VVDPEALRATLQVHRDEPAGLIDVIVLQAVLSNQPAALIAQLQAGVAALDAQVRDQTDRNQRLQRRVEELERTRPRPPVGFQNLVRLC